MIDRETNNVSLFNVVEELTVPAQPPLTFAQLGLPHGVLLVAFQLVVLWVRSDLGVPERGQGRIRIETPNQTIAHTQEIEVDLTQFLRLRAVIGLPGLPGLPAGGGEGDYQFRIDGRSADSEWTEMFQLPLRVVFQPPDSS